MNLVAGIDIGNATTELAIADHAGEKPTVCHVARTDTQGRKGSRESLEAAARLLGTVEHDLGVKCRRVAIARLQPVESVLIDLPAHDSLPLPLVRLDPSSIGTPGGLGFAIGRHYAIHELEAAPAEVPLVVSVPMDVTYERAAALVNSAWRAGRDVVAVLAERDEGVLIANRLDTCVPVVDEVEVAGLSPGQTVAAEVVGAGCSVARIADIFVLADAFGIPPDERLSRFTETLSDVRSAAVALGTAPPDQPDPEWWVEVVEDDALVKIPLARPAGAFGKSLRPGSVRRIRVPLADEGAPSVLEVPAHDFFALSLEEIGLRSFARSGALGLGHCPAAFVEDTCEERDPKAVLEGLVDRPVVVAGDEGYFARLGAVTTPGAPADAIVCDMGAGTLDVVDNRVTTVVGGAGHLVTLAVAYALHLPVPVAEQAKRGRSFLVESPGLARHEDGSRGFLKPPAPPDLLGCLCCPSDEGILPIARGISPAEWRVTRLSIKAQVYGENVERCLRESNDAGSVMLLCGGGALDQEAVRVVSSVFQRMPISVGRADVAGYLGPRYAAAVGLATGA